MMLDLSSSEQLLIDRAARCAERAYAPYSDFRVGAAVQTAMGVHVGCNVENVCYPVGMCAERNALAAAVAAEGPAMHPDNVAIVATGVHGEVLDCSPCGACRQFIAEFNPNAHVLYRWEGRLVKRQLFELLPESTINEALRSKG
jgi:cytidine deaminase